MNTYTDIVNLILVALHGNCNIHNINIIRIKRREKHNNAS